VDDTGKAFSIFVAFSFAAIEAPSQMCGVQRKFSLLVAARHAAGVKELRKRKLR
jgi:hypothetical protein